MSDSFSSEQSKLSTPIKIQTSVPFVEHKREEGPDAVTKLVEITDRKIEVELCSELTRYHANAELFEKNGRVQLVHDNLSQPAVFSLDAANRLCLLRHVSGAAEGWSSRIISPEGLRLTAFDVIQDESDVLVAAIALEQTSSKERYSLHCLKTSLEDRTASEKGEGAGPANAEGKFSGNSLSAFTDLPTLEWIEVKDNIDRPVGPLRLSTVMWKSLPKKANGESQIFQVVLGTNASSSAGSGGRTGSIYTARINVSDRNPWTKLTFPANASGLLQTSPMILGDGDGNTETAMVSVFHDSNESAPSRCAGHVFAPDGGFIRQFEIKAGILEGVNSVFSHLNPWDRTDLILAGNNGIGVCDSHHSYDTVSDEHILKGISFKQVVCAEAEDSSRPKTHYRLAIFAVSVDNELYYVDGERNYSNDNPRMTFKSSGLPIRRNVTQLSARYNSLQCSSELLLATENDTALRFLRREPSGKSWTEDCITRKGSKSIQMDAFVTNLVLTDGLGKPVPPDYEVKITSEPLHIVANDKSYATGMREIVLTTDENGSILIAIPANGKIACPPLNLSIGTFKFTVDPAQRVDRLIGKLNSNAALSGAKASNGDMIFAGCAPETLSDAASVLGKYGDIKTSVTKPSDTGGRDIDLSANDEANSWGNWFEKAAAWAEMFMGDCIESIKYVVKTTVKMAIRIVGPVVKLVFKIGKALCSFVVKTLDTVLTALGNFLENTLGIDFLNRLLKFVKAMFDPAAIRATQEILKSAVTGSISLAERFLVVNRLGITDLFDDAEDVLKKYIDDPREPRKGGSSSRSLGWITNNPVVRLISKINPISWIMEAISEEAPDFKSPSIEPLMNQILNVISPSMLSQASLIAELWDAFSQEMSTIFSDPTQFVPALVRALKAVAWTLTDTIKNAILSIYDVIIAVVKQLQPILTGAWKLGGLTDMWEELTGQDFTILNFLTYPVALMTNITAVVVNGKLPFEGRADALKSFNFNSIEIKPFYESGRTKKANQPVEATTQWGQEQTNETPLPLAQESQFSEIQASNSALSEREILRRICVLVENMSRIGISYDLIKEAQKTKKQVEKRQQLLDSYRNGDISHEQLVEYLPLSEKRYAHVITKWRTFGIVFHAIAIFGGTYLHERPFPSVGPSLDPSIACVAIAEIMLVIYATCCADSDIMLQTAGCAAQFNTILRSVKEDRVGASSISFITSATASLLAFSWNKVKFRHAAYVLIGIDGVANLTGLVTTMISLSE